MFGIAEHPEPSPRTRYRNIVLIGWGGDLEQGFFSAKRLSKRLGTTSFVDQGAQQLYRKSSIFTSSSLTNGLIVRVSNDLELGLTPSLLRLSIEIAIFDSIQARIKMK